MIIIFLNINKFFITVLFIIRVIVVINPHVGQAGPRGPKYYNFGDRFYSQSARKLRSWVFL